MQPALPARAHWGRAAATTLALLALGGVQARGKALGAAPAQPASASPWTAVAPRPAPALPAPPLLSPKAPAQIVFDEVNDLLESRYGGLSKVDRPALRTEYQERLYAVCHPEPLNCAEETAYPVLEAELTALEDEHSSFQTPEDFESFVASATGGNRLQYGVKLGQLDGESRVVLEVVPQSAAEEAGLRRGDVLRTIDGEPYLYTAFQAARREGRAIKLGIERLGQPLALSVQARESSTRDLPRLSYVGDVAVLRIPTFLSGGGVAQRVHELVAEAKTRGVRGIVVDLRGNTGGSLSECDSAVSAFVPSFIRVARTSTGSARTSVSKGVRSESGRGQSSVRNPSLWTGPMAVLVNNVSASCSEFFAYEVQYLRRGPVIGEETAGVGNTATRVFEVGEKAALQLTVTHYTKPDGKPYPTRITPDQAQLEGEAELRRLTQGDDVLLRLGVAAVQAASGLAKGSVSPPPEK